MQKMEGLFAPLPTFLKENGDIDLGSNISAAKKLLDTTIDGLFLLGTTGEFAYFTMDEKFQYLDSFAEKISQPKPIVCCVSHWSQKKALEITEHALNKGYRYVAALLPIYFPVTEDNIGEYYRAIRKLINEYDTNIPLIFYHIPVFSAAVEVRPELVIRLANEGIVQGVKNSTPDLEHGRKIIENTNDKFSFLCGTESLLFQGFRDGMINSKFDGGIFSGLNVMPYTYSSLFKSVKESNRDEFARLWPLVDEFSALFDHGLTYLPQITKYGMKSVGYEINDTIRAPLGLINSYIKKEVTTIVRKVQNYWGSTQI